MGYRLLLDTNVLLDFIDASRPQSDEAVEVFRRCARGDDEGCVSATSLKDVYHVCRKYLGDETARDFYRAFLQVLEVLPVDGVTCRLALDSSEPDVEDGIVRVLAEEHEVDVILTRDAQAFRASTVRSMDARTYLSQMV